MQENECQHRQIETSRAHPSINKFYQKQKEKATYTTASNEKPLRKHEYTYKISK